MQRKNIKKMQKLINCQKEKTVDYISFYLLLINLISYFNWAKGTTIFFHPI